MTLSFCLLTKSSITDHLLHDFTEQYTEEQQDTTAITGETSVLDTDMEPSEEVAESKDSVALDSTEEVILEECLPEQETLDVTCGHIEIKDGSEKSTAATTFHGETFC